MRRLSLVLALTACGPKGPAPVAPATDGPPDCTILGINDTYRVGPKRDGSGGLGRIRTLIAELEQRNQPHLTLHAGDLIYPSLLSREFNGQQMIAAMNLLDGDAERFDPTLIAALGNHELEKAKAAPLQAALDASGFQWLNGNVRFAKVDGVPSIQSAHLAPWTAVDCGPVTVAVVSATLDEQEPPWVEGFDDVMETVLTATAAARAAGAELVIGLTHLEAADDRAILAHDGAPDLILGGHDHAAMTETVNGRLLLKADADAASAQRVSVWLDGPTPRITAELVSLRADAPVPVDPAFVALDASWNARFDETFCSKQGKPADCLQAPLATTGTAWIGEELTIRRFETNLGNWIADQMLAAGAPKGATIAFTNSGGLRLNQDIPAGDTITLRDVEDLLPYANEQRLIRLTGAQLQQVVDRAVQGWTGSGHWLQISGFAFRHDPVHATATGLTLLTPDGPRPIQPDETLLAVTNAFLLNGGDGYAMLSGVEKLDPLTPLKTLVLDGLRAATGPISPKVEGRICHADRAPCLAVR